jgi:hypothetical protein
MSTYKFYNPYSHLSEARELSPEEWERIKVQLSPSDLDDIENGGRVKVGKAARVWKA